MSKFLDERGLAYFWQLAKDYIDTNTPKLVSLLTNDRGFITNATNQLINYYTQSNTYNRLEIQLLLNTASNFEYVIVLALPVPSADTLGKFYLFNGHRWITEGDDPYNWVDLGSYDVNLAGYVTELALDMALTDRPTFVEVSETDMLNLIDEESYIPGVIYYSLEED